MSITSLPTVIGSLLAGIGSFLLELLGGAVVEGLVEALWLVVREPFRSERESHPVLSAISLVVLGSGFGAATYWLHQERIIDYPGPHGLSLILAPLGAGVVMHWYGAWRRQRDRAASRLATFWGGAGFAFAMSATRFLLFFKPWV